jgi:hypothetical protein
MSSQRTTTTFWPLRICLATIEARRPRRWPLPSMVTGAVEKVAIWNTLRGVGVESEHEENSKESRAASERGESAETERARAHSPASPSLSLHSGLLLEHSSIVALFHNRHAIHLE